MAALCTNGIFSTAALFVMTNDTIDLHESNAGSNGPFHCLFDSSPGYEESIFLVDSFGDLQGAMAEILIRSCRPNDTLVPSDFPSFAPSFAPSRTPSASPSRTPSADPSHAPSFAPLAVPSKAPSPVPSRVPSQFPTSRPTVPTAAPSIAPFALNCIWDNFILLIDSFRGFFGEEESELPGSDFRMQQSFLADLMQVVYSEDKNISYLQWDLGNNVLVPYDTTWDKDTILEAIQKADPLNSDRAPTNLGNAIRKGIESFTPYATPQTKVSMLVMVTETNFSIGNCTELYLGLSEFNVDLVLR